MPLSIDTEPLLTVKEDEEWVQIEKPSSSAFVINTSEQLIKVNTDINNDLKVLVEVPTTEQITGGSAIMIGEDENKVPDMVITLLVYSLLCIMYATIKSCVVLIISIIPYIQYLFHIAFGIVCVVLMCKDNNVSLRISIEMKLSSILSIFERFDLSSVIKMFDTIISKVSFITKLRKKPLDTFTGVVKSLFKK